MYASRTKRLCVRAAQSEETRVQHHHPTSAASATINIRCQTTHNQSVDASVNQTQILAIKEDQISASNAGVNIESPLTNHISQQMTSSIAAMTNSNGQPKNNETIATSPGLDPMRASMNTSSQHHHVTNGCTSLDSHKTSSNNNLEQTVVTQSEHDQAGLEHELINKLARESSDVARHELLITIRNLITACNMKKDFLINSPEFSKLIGLLSDYESSSKVKTQLVLLICTLAKGGVHNVQKLNEFSVDQKIYELVTEQCQDDLQSYTNKIGHHRVSFYDHELIEACLRCLRSLMSWPSVSRGWLLYEAPHQLGTKYTSDSDRPDVDHLRLRSLTNVIAYAKESSSFTVQECVSDIIALTCDRHKDQNLLFKADALSCIFKLLESKSERVIRASLSWLSQLCLRNQFISARIIESRCASGMKVLDRLTCLMSKDMYPEVQSLAARCFAHICRSINSNSLMNDPRVSTHVLQTLIRMVHSCQPAAIRVKSAECIAYLVENDKRLQSTASICDHLIDSLADMLDYGEKLVLSELAHNLIFHKNQSDIQEKDNLWRNCRPSLTIPSSQSQVLPNQDTSFYISNSDCDSEIGNDMKRASFLALASLASNLEQVRKKISNTCPIVEQLIKSLVEVYRPSNPRTTKAALTCLLSLSRSVKQLRTSLADKNLYNSLKTLLFTSFDDSSVQSKDILTLVVAILCNITLNFSPGRLEFIEDKAIEIFCTLTKAKEYESLRLSSLWILMNLTYEVDDPSLRTRILQALDIPYILILLQSDEEHELVLKTLGLLRNLLSQQQQVDLMMEAYGREIVKTLAQLLSSHHPYVIKEQAMCVLANIADGIESKNYIMSNEQVLYHIGEMLADLRVGDARLAALDCIRNLVQREYDGSSERRDELKKRGFDEKLKFLLKSEDSALLTRAQKTYNQFDDGLEDRFVN